MTLFNIKELASILEMLDKHDVTEFKLERGEERISLKRGKPAPRRARLQHIHGMPQMITAVPSMMPGHMPGGNPLPSNVIPLVNPVQNQQAQDTGASYGDSQAVHAQQAQAIPKKSLKEVTSPMVGTFYRRPAVDAEPYVSVGDAVKKGDVICIVEAMKLMNEIESDTAGRVVEICLEDGQMVEYGEVLFRIEPL